MIGRVGGKSKLKKQIISIMPQHKVYVEPFFLTFINFFVFKL